MTEHAIAVNFRALSNLAARLERLGYTGDALAEAENIAVNLLADGFRKLELPPPLTGPSSTDAGRRRARELFAQVRREREEGR